MKNFVIAPFFSDRNDYFIVFTICMSFIVGFEIIKGHSKGRERPRNALFNDMILIQAQPASHINEYSI